ncbi:hypothetical protein Acr_10g0002270 [Actinidia rufa]|uniref:Uncharacterized protein n=1 Tax=Actinidia rufa TaxID=165716 RepID=A0A7J0F809_9ERIC|nr:hypothetical protein Acr_10g0002270 [Actinidia rufa]
MKQFKAAALKLTTFRCSFCRGLAICRWLSNLITQILAAQATKPVTLGPPVHHGSPHMPNLGPSPDVVDYESEQSVVLCTNDGFSQDRKGLEPIQDEDKTDHEKKPEEDETQVKGPPKKMVSINDRAEVLIFSSKEKRRTKSTIRLPFMKSKNDEEPKPLKSILKVGSMSNDETTN